MHKQTVASQNVRRLLACMLVAALVAGLLQAALAMPLINFGNGFGSYAADSADAGTDTAADSVPSPCFVKAKASGGTALKISWARVSGASGYVVYRSVGKSKFRKAKTLKGASKTSWKNSGLKKNKVYRYKVRAYTKAGGDTRYSAYSYAVSAKPYSKKSKTANVSRAKTNYPNRLLGLNAYGKYTADVRLETAGGKRAISQALRWRSSDTSLVKVDAKGNLRALGSNGKCYVYAFAHSGVYARFTVSVGDYAHPAQFGNLDKIGAKAAGVLRNNKEDLNDIVAEMETHSGTCRVTYEGGSLHVVDQTQYFSAATESKMENLLKTTGMSYIALYDGSITFGFPEKDSCDIIYGGVDVADQAAKKSGSYKIAPGWYCRFAVGED